MKTKPTTQPSELNTEAMRRLYDSGHNDREIAAELGISRRSVWTWRQEEGLPPASRRYPTSRPQADKPARVRKGPKPRLDEAAAMAAYTAGRTDKEIAEERGCSVPTIALWRKRMGLPPNLAPRPTHKPRARTYDLPAAAVEARAREAGLTYGQYQAREWEANGRPAYRKRKVPDPGTGKE